MKAWNDRSMNLKAWEDQDDDDKIICRCEEIRKGEIRKAVHQGMFTMTEIKRFLRAGMGLCQGQTCGKLVRGLIAAELGISPLELDMPTARPPARPTEMQVLANETVHKGGES